MHIAWLIEPHTHMMHGSAGLVVCEDDEEEEQCSWSCRHKHRHIAQE